MPDSFSVDISGIEETCAMLSTAPVMIARAAFARALAAAAVPVVQQLRALTPVDTGELKKSILTDIALDPDGKGGVASIGYGKNGYIANFVEYGHRMIGHGKEAKEIGAVRPHPFMRPAAAASGEAAIDAFNQSVQATMANGIPGLETGAA